MEVLETTTNQISAEELRDKCLASYSVFCSLMQDDGWFDPVHRYLCDWTQAQIMKQIEILDRTGQCEGKLAFVMPRGSLKSTMVTKYLPVWLVLYFFYVRKDSSIRSLVAGNTFTNAKKKLKNIRSLFDDVPLFRTLFPEVLPRLGRKGSKWSDEGAEINRTGSFEEATFECAGTNTKLTGRHYNIHLEDDTTAPDVDEMKENMTLPSRDTIEKAIGFHKAAFPLFVPKGFRLSIVVSTRWANEDLIDYVEKNENYCIFNMPAKSKDGKNNFSCFYSNEVLKEIEKRIGSFMFHMLYLNEPQDPSTRIFNKGLFQWIEPDAVPKKGFFTIAVDPAISEADSSCDSSITVKQHILDGTKRTSYWWEDVNAKLLPFQLAHKILETADKYDCVETPVKAIIIEGNAYQKALKYILLNLMEERKFKCGKVYSIMSFDSGSTSGKDLRIRSMQPAFEQRREFFVKGKLSDQTESQLIQYPNGKLVDTIDSWSMHWVYWKKDFYETPQIDNTPKEDTFEAACLEIKNRNSKAAWNINSGLSYSVDLSDTFGNFGL